MSSEPTAWRQQWLALLDDPSNEALAHGLRDAIALDQRRALDQLDADARDERLIALARLLRDLFMLHHIARERAPFEPGPYWLELLANVSPPPPSKDDDDDDDDDSDGWSEPPPDPADPFYAWDLEREVPDLPPAQRSATIDAATMV